MGFIRGFGQFWYDLIVGDDWKVAAAVATTLALGTVVLLTTGLAELVFTPVLGVALMAAFVVALLIDVRK
ncbi:hypothetical protein AB0J42_33710 [Nonomuraea sp. NPDC049649]|uniref:hypothetical protein n=1 Tax=Nonomuraea sp. NPDC049649 TaxID=3155776 RepID=UPI003433D659